MADTTAPTDLEKKCAALSYQIAHRMASQWLTARVFLDSELERQNPSLKGQLPGEFMQVWREFGIALLQGRADQFKLFTNALNTLPGNLMVPLVNVSAELSLIPERFKADLLAQLSPQKDTLTTGGSHV